SNRPGHRKPPVSNRCPISVGGRPKSSMDGSGLFIGIYWVYRTRMDAQTRTSFRFTDAIAAGCWGKVDLIAATSWTTVQLVSKATPDNICSAKAPPWRGRPGRRPTLTVPPGVSPRTEYVWRVHSNDRIDDGDRRAICSPHRSDRHAPLFMTGRATDHTTPTSHPAAIDDGNPGRQGSAARRIRHVNALL